MARPSTPSLAFDLSRHEPDLERRMTVRLHPRRGDARWNGSNVGGAIAWPADEPWPHCVEHGFALVAVLQLRASDVPELPFPDGTDLFQLLWCPTDHEDAGYGPQPFARWRSFSTALEERASPAVIGATDDYLPRPCSLTPERVQELPSAFELGIDRVKRLDELIAREAESDLARLGIDDDPLYQYHFSVAPGTKVGGHVHWVQDPDVPVCACGVPMQHLLTIASAEFDGAYQRWMPEGERRVWQQGYDARSAVQSAAGLMIGDMGSFFVFVCGHCPDRPIRGLVQSS